ncbi:hypothetical protein [Vibrio sp. THAF190c]|uniref:competence protein CoiA family protein n=1 Tax=Vibrio sp. THAF190c TaxID=2587865 RepID=UPI0012680B5E|nr:hypothetical protein [Vibrio sp. THAF190c]QFT13274.1 hypothetical protein FIV04_25325 [Vibrio sp. THAF190c]
MDTDYRHSIWELELEDKSTVLACDLIECLGSGDDDIGQALLKRHIALGEIDDKIYVRCSECGCPLVYVARNAVQSAHFRHQVSKANSIEQVKKCSFYTQSHQFFGAASIYHGEGKWHMEHKYWLAQLLELSSQVVSDSIQVEKYLFDKDPEKNARRRPDVYFETVSGDCFAIELTRWWMDPRVVIERERFFRRQGINLLWLFSPTCAEHNSATFNLVLYSGGNEPSYKPDLTEAGLSGHCNAFVLTDDTKNRSNTEQKLWFEVQFPVFSAHTDIQYLSKTIHSTIATLTDLNLDPKNRLPYAVPTLDNYRQARDDYLQKVEEDTQNKRDKLARRVRKVRTMQSELKAGLATLHYHDIYDHIRVLNELTRPLLVHSFGGYLQKRTEQLIALLRAQKQKLEEASQKRQALSQLEQIENSMLLSQQRLHGAFSTNLNTELKELERMLEQLEEIKNTIDNDKAEQLADALLVYIQELKTNPDRPIPLNLPGTQEQLAECYKFLQELNETGVTELPTGHNNIKLARLERKCLELGRYDLVQQLSTALTDAERQFKARYAEENFPALSKGWCAHGQYRDELMKAKSILTTEYRRGHKQFAKHEALQRFIRWLLNDFRDSIEEIIESQYTVVLKHFSGAIEKVDLQKLANCAGYLEQQLRIPLDDEHKRLLIEILQSK